MKTPTPKRKVGWSMIPPYIMARPDLNDGEKIVYGKIKGLVSDRGYCYATNEYIAENVLKSPNTISHIVTELVRKGLLKVVLIYTDRKEVKERRIFITGSEKSAYPIAEDDHTPIATDGYTPSHARLVENRYESEEETTPQSLAEGVSAEGEVGSEVNEVWDHFLKVSGQKPIKTPGRVAKIKTRLKTFSVTEIKKALTNCFADGFYNGTANDRGWKATADWIFKTDEITERMRDYQPRREKLIPGEYDINVKGVGSFKKIVSDTGETKILSSYQYRLDKVAAGQMPEASLPDKKLALLEAREGELNGTEKQELADLRQSVPLILQAHADWKEGLYDNL